MDKNKPLIHPRTALALESLSKDPPQGLLFSGPRGAGKRYLALQWVKEVNGAEPVIIEPGVKAGIAIEQVRGLYHTTRSKQTTKRFFILDHADSMSNGAQNAFLKLLEEPNEYTSFILIADRPHMLLPTIRSRIQEINVLALERDVLIRHLQESYPQLPKEELQQILFISRNRVGLAVQLASDKAMLDSYKAAAADAKQFLLGSTTERLIRINSLTDREKTITFLQLIAQMASTLLAQSGKNKEQTLAWTQRARLVQEVLERIHTNANIKAQLTFLAVSL
jgi:DNA polymerase-3 subunit delta'